ncbi:MAG: hypothetical protein K1V89_06685, partial [Muribaculaceae bacterium]
MKPKFFRRETYHKAPGCIMVIGNLPVEDRILYPFFDNAHFAAFPQSGLLYPSPRPRARTVSRR